MTIPTYLLFYVLIGSLAIIGTILACALPLLTSAGQNTTVLLRLGPSQSF
jgi:hypothetical protein